MRRLAGPVFVLVWWACVVSRAFSATVEQSIQPREAGIGTPVRYTVTFKTSATAEVQDPSFAGAPSESLEIVDRSVSRPRRFFGKQVVRFVSVLRSFEPGIFDVPEVEVRYREKGAGDWQVARAPVQSVEVKSALAGQQGPSILKDIKGPLSAGRRFGTWWLIAVIAAAAALALRRFLDKKKVPDESAAVLEPADVIALRELDELARKDYVHKGMIKEYFVEVSLIVRRYLERRFNVHAPEMTTEEFLYDAGTNASLEEAHKGLLADFLRCCDLVKFARYSPEAAEIQKAFDSAKRFVEQTRVAEAKQGPPQP